MQEDKNLKELLMKWAVENPPTDFTTHVMQRITADTMANAHTAPLLKQRLIQVLLSVFILVCMALLALCLTTPTALPFQFTIKLPVKYFSQAFSFLIAFWTVMLLNLLLKKSFLNRSTV
jgi:hypothetical protein